MTGRSSSRRSDLGPNPTDHPPFDPYSPVTISSSIVLTTVLTLVYLNLDRLRRIASTHSHRRKLRRIIASEDAATHDKPATRPVVSGLFVHPVKSLRPVPVSTSSVTNLGLDGDRCLMIVRPNPTTIAGSAAAQSTTTTKFNPNAATHRFVTQRQCPSLATVEASLPTETSGGRVLIKLTCASWSGGKGGSSVEEESSSSSVHVDVTDSALLSLSSLSPAVRYKAGLWDDTVDVVDVGDEAAAFVQSIVTHDDQTRDDPSYAGVRLVAMIPPGGGPSSNATCRTLDSRYLPPAALTSWGGVPRTSLNDGFPLLVACESSLEELNRRLVARGKAPIPMSRFRPNIVVSGTEPFEEDTWKAILIRGGGSGSDRDDGVILHLVKGCPRCKQSCTDQSTGERSAEPLETLATFRALGTTSGDDVYFGQNAVLQGSEGEISVGDEVVVLTRGEPVWDRDTVQAE